MAAREGDVALWLHNKLGSTDDLWSGSSICAQLTREKLTLIQDCFHNLQPHVKVKLLLSFLHIPKRNVEEWRHELEELVHTALDDTDQWVTMVAEMLKVFPATGALNTEVDEHQNCFHDIVNDLRKMVRRCQDTQMAPLECSYLSRNAQISVTGQLPQPVKHFALKRKSKSAALRAEILQKSTEAANNLKRMKNKNPGVSLPLKIRSFAKKMDDESPMRGIPNPTNSGFLRSNTLGSRFGGSTPLGQRTPSRGREGGIKFLDIKEQPLGAKEAKKLKKKAEQEAIQAQKKQKEAQANTPDYAAGLVNPAGLVNASLVNSALGQVEMNAGPSYVPNVAGLASATTTLPGSAVSIATQQARDSLQQHLDQQILPSTTVTITNPANHQTTIALVMSPATTNTAPLTIDASKPGTETTDSNTAQNQPRKGLSLTREQMFAAQEMFRASNKVTRPEKALILGFMAGSRDNPCPQQGHIVNIRLSEDIDSIQQPGGLFKPMQVDTYIQMNYETGEWKRIKKYHEVISND